MHFIQWCVLHGVLRQWNLDYPNLGYPNAASYDVQLMNYTVHVVNIIIIGHEYNLIQKLWLL